MIPTVVSDELSSSLDGRPIGEPQPRWMTAATPQPIAMLPSTLAGSPWPATTVARTAKKTMSSITRWTTRERYGSPAAATAMAKLTWRTGKLSV